MVEIKTPEILVKDPIVDLCIGQLERILAVDEVPSSVRKHSKDGPYKYRRAWFNEVRLVVELAMTEIYGDDIELKEETDEEHAERIKRAKEGFDISGKHTTNKDIETEERIDILTGRPVFPDVYKRVIEVEKVNKDDICEVFDYWGKVMGSREKNFLEDVEVGNKIVRLMIAKLYEV